MHGKPSLQADGTEKYFWLMGFSETSGGLLREAGYLKKQQAFLANPAAQAALRRRLGLPETPRRAGQCFCFGYAGAQWADWLAAWQAAGELSTACAKPARFPNMPCASPAACGRPARCG